MLKITATQRSIVRFLPLAAMYTSYVKTLQKCKNVTDLLYQYNELHGAKTSPAAARGGGKKIDFFLFLSVTLLNERVWCNDFAMKRFWIGTVHGFALSFMSLSGTR